MLLAAKKAIGQRVTAQTKGQSYESKVPVLSRPYTWLQVFPIGAEVLSAGVATTRRVGRNPEKKATSYQAVYVLQQYRSLAVTICISAQFISKKNYQHAQPKEHVDE